MSKDNTKKTPKKLLSVDTMPGVHPDLAAEIKENISKKAEELLGRTLESFLNHNSFYAHLAYKLDRVSTTKEGTFGVYPIKRDGTYKWGLVYSPEFLIHLYLMGRATERHLRKSKSQSELMRLASSLLQDVNNFFGRTPGALKYLSIAPMRLVVEHELMHVGLKHFDRIRQEVKGFKNKDYGRYQANLAADATINTWLHTMSSDYIEAADQVAEDSGSFFMKGGFFSQLTLHKCIEDKAIAKEDWMLLHKENLSKKFLAEEAKKVHQYNVNSFEENMAYIKAVFEKELPPEMLQGCSMTGNEVFDEDGNEVGDASEIPDSEWQTLKREETKNLKEAEKEAGKTPGWFKEQLPDMEDADISLSNKNWKELLLESMEVGYSTECSWNEPNYGLMGTVQDASNNGIELSMFPGEKAGATANAIMILDVSGSMNPRELQEGGNAFVEIAEELGMEDITLVQHDTRVTAKEEINGAAEIREKLQNIRGRGGTSIKNMIRTGLRSRHVNIVICTDGEDNLDFSDLDLQKKNIVFLLTQGSWGNPEVELMQQGIKVVKLGNN